MREGGTTEIANIIVATTAIAMEARRSGSANRPIGRPDSRRFGARRKNPVVSAATAPAANSTSSTSLRGASRRSNPEPRERRPSRLLCCAPIDMATAGSGQQMVRFEIVERDRARLLATDRDAGVELLQNRQR